MSVAARPEDQVPPPTFADLDGHAPSAPEPPQTWVYDSIALSLTPDAPATWNISDDESLIGVLTLHATGETQPGAVWRISDPDAHTLGAGAAWATWEDAVASLIEYRRPDIH